MFKDKILLFFDALLDVFEGNNKIIYYKIIGYRHLIQNVISTPELLKILTDFIIVPSNYEILKQQNIEKVISYDLNIYCINDTPETFSTTIFKQLVILLNSCNIENQKIIWKWIHNIIQTVSVEANIVIPNILEASTDE
jgi:hypothetical protein